MSKFAIPILMAIGGVGAASAIALGAWERLSIVRVVTPAPMATQAASAFTQRVLAVAQPVSSLSGATPEFSAAAQDEQNEMAAEAVRQEVSAAAENAQAAAERQADLEQAFKTNARISYVGERPPAGLDPACADGYRDPSKWTDSCMASAHILYMKSLEATLQLSAEYITGRPKKDYRRCMDAQTEVTNANQVPTFICPDAVTEIDGDESAER